MPEVRQRSTRTLKVTEVKLSDEDRRNLAELYKDARYESLLNLMERACIETETAHFNTPINDVEGILGGHLLTKATWLFFQYVQRQVAFCYNAQTAEQEAKEEPQTPLEEMIQGVEGFSTSGNDYL